METLPSLLFACGFLYYAVQVYRGQIEPHFGSWAVWTVISVSNAIACLFVMDTMQACLVPIVDAVCVSSFLAFMWHKRGGKCELTPFDRALCFMAVVGVTTIVLSANLSTLLVQIPLLLAAIPTLKGAMAGDEDASVWTVWTVALLINLGVTAGGFFQWVYPVVMGALHVAVLGCAIVATAKSATRIRKFAKA